MESVIDIKHFSDLVKVPKSGGGKLISNCYLLPKDIEKYIHQGHMFWERFMNGMLFFCEETDFYYLYFYLIEKQNQFSCNKLDKCNKPVIIDFVYLESNIPESFFELKKLWKENGFNFYKTYRRMSMDISLDKNISDRKIALDNNYELTFAQLSQLEEIQELWRFNLDIFSTALPRERELMDLLVYKQIPVILDEERKIIAALQFQRSGKICTIKHVVVDKMFRQRGFAKVLLQFCLANNQDINKYVLWVDENNIPATTFYQKNGFSFDGKITYQLILRDVLKGG